MKPLKFVHITKTAGSTMEHIGQGWGTRDIQLKKVYDDREHKLNIPFWHCPFQYIKTDMLDLYLNKYDLFAIVRNPYTRCVSEFHCINGGSLNPHYKTIYKKCLAKYTVNDFNNFIKDRLNDIINITSTNDINLIKNHDMLSFSVGGHWLPQHMYIYDCANNKIVQHVLKFENLKDDFEILMKQYNLNFILDKHERKSISKFTVNDLSVDTKLLIQKVYHNDFVKFGYQF